MSAEETDGEGSSRAPRARVFAFYLPQFHPFVENDEFWGKGFTEWTNVTKAKRLFPGHDQPRLPADLGFYDLRVAETREAQAALARAHGVEGFCYWHYWFGDGRRVMQRPFDEVLASGRPDFPFCVAWANHPWVGPPEGRRGTRRTLIEQTYPGPADERAHFELLLPAFRDTRYVRVDGKPLFIVFLPGRLPDAPAFIAYWRRLAAGNGLPGLFIAAMSATFDNPSLDPFDAVVGHPPQDYVHFHRRRSLLIDLARKLRERNFGRRIHRWIGEGLRKPARFDYADVVRRAIAPLPNDPRCIPCVLPNWDNTPRLGARGFVYENTTPALFQRYLRAAIDKVAAWPPGRRAGGSSS